VCKFWVSFVVFAIYLDVLLAQTACFTSALLCRPSKASAPSNLPFAALPAFKNIQPAAHAGHSVATPTVRRVAQLPTLRHAVHAPGTTPHDFRNVQPVNLQLGDVISVEGLNGKNFVVTGIFLDDGVEWVQFMERGGYVLNNCGRMFLLNKLTMLLFSSFQCHLVERRAIKPRGQMCNSSTDPNASAE
jgi:hypothetical protein